MKNHITRTHIFHKTYGNLDSMTPFTESHIGSRRNLKHFIWIIKTLLHDRVCHVDFMKLVTDFICISIALGREIKKNYFTRFVKSV